MAIRPSPTGSPTARTVTFLVLVLVLVPWPAQAEPPQDPELPQRYVVLFHDEVPPEARDASWMGAPIVARSPELAFVALELDDPARDLRGIVEHPDVERVEVDGRVELDSEPDDPWFPHQYGLEQVGAPGAWETRMPWRGKAICIVDNGVREFEELPADRWLGDARFGDHVPGPVGHPGSYGAHGTSVASVALSQVDNGVGIAGLSHGGILNADIWDWMGDTYWSDVARAVNWCVREGADIINMSFGGEATGVMARAVEDAWAEGTLLIASSGNDGPCDGCADGHFPAAFPEVVSVGCTNITRSSCSFSSTGSTVEFAAPGEDVPVMAGADWLWFQSGTSFSAPHVSGVAALVWSAHPGLTNVEVRQLLRDHAQDLGEPGRDPVFGFGVPNASAMMQALELPPSAPVNASAGPGPGPGTVEVAWGPPSKVGSVPVTGYEVLRANANGRFEVVGQVPASTHSFVDEGDEEGVHRAQRYRVRGLTSVGPTPTSLVACGAPPGADAGNPERVCREQHRVEWRAPMDAPLAHRWADVDQGEPEGRYAEVSTTGSANGAHVSAAPSGSSTGTVAVGGEDASGGLLAVSPANARCGPAYCVAVGTSAEGSVAVATGDASAEAVAVSLLGNASGTWAMSGTGNASGYWLAASGTGESHDAVLQVSGCEAARSAGYAEACGVDGASLLP